MKKRIKKLLSVILVFAFIISIIPVPLLKPDKAYAADCEASTYMKHKINYSQQGLDGS